MDLLAGGEGRSLSLDLLRVATLLGPLLLLLWRDRVRSVLTDGSESLLGRARFLLPTVGPDAVDSSIASGLASFCALLGIFFALVP